MRNGGADDGRTPGRPQGGGLMRVPNGHDRAAEMDDALERLAREAAELCEALRARRVERKGGGNANEAN